MKNHEDQLDVLKAYVEKRLASLESNISHMNSKLAELHEMQEDLAVTVKEYFQPIV